MADNQFTESHLEQFAFPDKVSLFRALEILHPDEQSFKKQCARLRFYNAVGLLFSAGLVCAIAATSIGSLFGNFDLSVLIWLMVTLLLVIIAKNVAARIASSTCIYHLRVIEFEKEVDPVLASITLLATATVFLFMYMMFMVIFVLAILHTVSPVKPNVIEYVAGAVGVVAAGLVYFIERKFGPLPEIP